VQLSGAGHDARTIPAALARRGGALLARLLLFRKHAEYASSDRQLRDQGHRWKLILSEGGPHELYDLSTDPDELLNLYGVPCDDEHDQYRHFEPHDQIVHELAGRMKDEADAIGDEQGATLAQAVCDQQIQRYDWNVSNATGLRL
jgi:hypothetical protein